MGYQPLEELLPRAGMSVYRLSRMAAKRALELSEGKPKLLDNVNSDKVTTIALEEIMHGKVECKVDQSSADKKK